MSRLLYENTTGVATSPNVVSQPLLESDKEDALGLEDEMPTRPPLWRRLLPLSAALLMLAIIVVGALVLQKTRGVGTNQTRYKLAAATIGTVKKTVAASGTPKPWSTVDIKSKAGGRVDRLLVEVGDVVKRGQVIARIDPTDTLLSVQQSQADVDSAQANLASSADQFRLQVKQSALAIETARAQLANTEAALNASRAQRDTARTQAVAQPAQTSASIHQASAAYDAAVKNRQQLDSTQPQEKAQAEAGYEQAFADNENNQANLARQQSLLQSGFVSQQAVDQARATATSSKAALESAKKKRDTLDAAQGAVRASADAQVQQALAQLENARAQTDVISRTNALHQAEASYKQAQTQVRTAQASLEQAIANQANNEIKRQAINSARASGARAKAGLTNAQSTLAQTVVRAPSDGVVLQKYVEQGTIITSGLSLNSTGTSIVQIGEIGRMYVDVAVDETDVAGVDEGQAVEVSVDAYPGVPFEGKVARVNPQAEVESNITSVHVRVEIGNETPSFRLLKPGMNATCQFVQGDREAVLTVPKAAIHEGTDGDSVDVATGGKPAPEDPDARIGVILKRTSVEVGLRGDTTVEITAGIKAGDSVVIQTSEPDTASETPKTTGAIGGGGPGGPPPGGGGRR